VIEGQETVRILETQSLHLQYLIIGKAVKYLPAHHVWSLIYIYNKKYILHNQQLMSFNEGFFNKMLKRNSTGIETKSMMHAHDTEYEDFLYRALDRIRLLNWLLGSHAFKIAEITTHSLCSKSQEILLNHISALWPIPILKSAKNWCFYEQLKINEVSSQFLELASRKSNQSLYYSFKQIERTTDKVTISDCKILNNKYMNKLMGQKDNPLNDNMACITIIPKGAKFLNILWLSLIAQMHNWKVPLNYPSNLIACDGNYYNITKNEELLFKWPTKNLSDKTKMQLVLGDRKSHIPYCNKCMKKIKSKKYESDL
jgi:hypothetical protein